jgi:hypothetical protein
MKQRSLFQSTDQIFNLKLRELTGVEVLQKRKPSPSMLQLMQFFPHDHEVARKSVRINDLSLRSRLWSCFG